MAPHKLIQAWMDLNNAKYEKEHHNETLSAALNELKETSDRKVNKTAQIKDLKRKADQQKKQTEAKRAKVTDLNNQLLRAKTDVHESLHLEQANDASKDRAETEHKLLSQAEADKQESVRAIERKGLNYEGNIKAKANKIDAETSEVKEALSIWSDTFFQKKSGALLYPTPKGLFLADNGDGHKDDESEVGSLSELANPKADDTFKEASGMIQRINNPMYLIDRVVDIMAGKFTDAQLGQALPPGTPVPFDGSTISGGKLCFMMDEKLDRLADAPTHILLAVVLSRRLDETAEEMVNTAAGTPITELAARGKVALEFVKEYKAELATPRKVDDTKLKKKILATASTGRLFKDIVDYHGRGILIVLPLAEFFNFTRKQRADNIPKGKLQALIEIVNNQDNALMLKTFKLLVTLLQGWIDYSTLNFSLVANKLNDKEQFMAEIKELRERLNLPLTPCVPFSREIDIKPVDRWELLASISGWNDARDTPLVVFPDDSICSMRVPNPCAILGEILGQRYAYHRNNFTVEYATDIPVDTMRFLVRLLFMYPLKESQHQSSVSVLDCRGKCLFDANAIAMEAGGAQVYFVMRLRKGWVLVWLLKGEDGEISEAVVFAHGCETCPPKELRKAVSDLDLDETIKPVYVNVPQPQENASGIHALCHVMALRSCGHHWVNELSDNNVMGIRHALLRATTMAFISASKAEDDKGKEVQGQRSQGEA